jgi:hypothetical protein
VTDDGPEQQPDLRHTEHERGDVRVSRDLSGEGHLARGDRTRMSRLNFTARARPRDDGARDPAFVERDAASAPPPAPPPAPPAAAEPAVAPDTADDGATLMQRVGRLFGR